MLAAARKLLHAGTGYWKLLFMGGLRIALIVQAGTTSRDKALLAPVVDRDVASFGGFWAKARALQAARPFMREDCFLVVPDCGFACKPC